MTNHKTIKPPNSIPNIFIALFIHHFWSCLTATAWQLFTGINQLWKMALYSSLDTASGGPASSASFPPQTPGSWPPSCCCCCRRWPGHPGRFFPKERAQKIGKQVSSSQATPAASWCRVQSLAPWCLWLSPPHLRHSFPLSTKHFVL